MGVLAGGGWPIHLDRLAPGSFPFWRVSGGALAAMPGWRGAAPALGVGTQRRTWELVWICDGKSLAPNALLGPPCPVVACRNPPGLCGGSGDVVG
jgi:hypothetical protein